MYSKNRLLLVVILIISSMIPKFGCAQMINLDRGIYFSSYDLQLLSPRLVTWTIHAADIGMVKREPSWRFVDDVQHIKGVATHDDYTNSGFHRGHLCPAKDRSFTISAMRQTFTTSNITPQTPQVNTGSWLRTEEWCRRAALKYDSVTVCVVPIWLPRDTTFIGSHRLAVAHAFFKSVWVARTDSIINTWFIWNR